MRLKTGLVGLLVAVSIVVGGVAMAASNDTLLVEGFDPENNILVFGVSEIDDERLRLHGRRARLHLRHRRCRDCDCPDQERRNRLPSSWPALTSRTVKPRVCATSLRSMSPARPARSITARWSRASSTLSRNN